MSNSQEKLIKLFMHPRASSFRNPKSEGGIRRVVEAYEKHLPKFGAIFVDTIQEADVVAVHAGWDGVLPDVAILHGLYWTGDYSANNAEYRANEVIIENIRHALRITVPSEWVSEPFKRDMHITPTVVPHGIEWQDWQHSYETSGFVLWNKNRVADVCNPQAVGELARRFPQQRFVTTFALDNDKKLDNVTVTGTMEHAEMREFVQRAGVYLATTPETFGIGTLEAMAAGVPVLCWNEKGNGALVHHGVTGYCAVPGDYDDLARGLEYCLEHREVLGANGRDVAKAYTWENAAAKLMRVIRDAYVEKQTPKGYSVVIPAHNKGDTLRRAIDGVMAQTTPAKRLVIVNDRSSDQTHTVVQIAKTDYANHATPIEYYEVDFGNVALTRNFGVSKTDTQFFIPLDADDTIEPEFAETLFSYMCNDNSLAVAYTSIKTVNSKDGSVHLPSWPGQFDGEKMIVGNNQVPTCCMVRRSVFDRVGGYKSRFAPLGAGSEDANLWLRMFAHGGVIRKVDNRPLFIYYWGSGIVSGNRNYREISYWHEYPYHSSYKPFAMPLPTQRGSHPVRQYDQPTISVIIPCAEHHAPYIAMALDSVESQSYPRWETIVVLDGFTNPNALFEVERRLKTAYPYVIVHSVGIKDPLGAGACRNIGAEMARGGMLLFLDADDWLSNSAMFDMLQAWNATQNIIYSDYTGVVVGTKSELSPEWQRRVIAEEGGLVYLDYKAQDFDCTAAVQEPREEGQPYIWCNVTSLVPTAWHKAIGGFDESMSSWEDVDYWWRLARAGYCFTRVPKRLMFYRFWTGQRREASFSTHNEIRAYLRDKYRSVPMSWNCGGKSNAVQYSLSGQQTTLSAKGASMMSDGEFLQVEYLSGNTGEHSVVGIVTKINYGYHRGGEILPNVHRKDVEASPRLFRPVAASTPVAPPPAAPPKPAEAPKRIGEELSDELRDKIAALRNAHFVATESPAENEFVGETQPAEELPQPTVAKRTRKPKAQG